jgi:hypothetical protein
MYGLTHASPLKLRMWFRGYSLRWGFRRLRLLAPAGSGSGSGSGSSSSLLLEALHWIDMEFEST